MDEVDKLDTLLNGLELFNKPNNLLTTNSTKIDITIDDNINFEAIRIISTKKDTIIVTTKDLQSNNITSRACSCILDGTNRACTTKEKLLHMINST
jgi:hypothetical protein